MPSNLSKIDFPYHEMKLKKLYFDPTYEKELEGADTEGIREVLQDSFYFSKQYEERPYIFNSLVTSIDGKIAFEDAPQGPLIAKNNKYANVGSLVDYWILNLLRGSADAILTGTLGINVEAKTGGTGHCYDEQIEIYRETMNKSVVPLGIVVTLDALDVNFEASIFRTDEKAIVFYTTEQGYQNLLHSQQREVIRIDGKNIVKLENINSKFIYAIVNGETHFEHNQGLYILKQMGIDRLLVESPTVSHFFMKEKLLDELFLNYSCLYVGGKATSIGMHNASFTSVDHPHTKLISIYMYNPHFLFLRHQLIYD